MPFAGEACRDRLGTLQVEIGDCHMGALSGQHAANPPPYAAGAAGDYGDPVAQVYHGFLLLDVGMADL